MPEMGFQSYYFNEDGFLKLKKDLNYIMNNLDHKNVRRLYTEYCQVKSENGETVIDGPVIRFTGNSTTQRMNVGYNTVNNDFGFTVWNQNGDQTAYLDSTGELIVRRVLAGYIQGSTIDGGTISGSTITGSYIFGSTIEGGTVSGSTILGGSITIGTGYKIKISEAALNGTLDFLSSDDVGIGAILYNSLGLLISADTGFLTLLHGSDNQIYLESTGISIYANSGTLDIWAAQDVVISNSSGKTYYGSTASTDEIATIGHVASNYATLSTTITESFINSNYATLSTTVTESYVDDFGYSLAWDGGTRTLDLKDRNGNTISSVVISS